MEALNISPALEGLTMQDNEEEPRQELLFSEDESWILGLYDQVQQLQLELALTKAKIQLSDENTVDNNQETGEDNGSEIDDSEDDGELDATTIQEIKDAKERLLNAMAPYTLRNSVVNNVLIADPILKATHGSTFSSPIEDNILPWIKKRDTTSQAVQKQSNELRSVLDQLTEVESETLRVSKKNQELAQEVLRLVEEADRGKTDAIADPAARKEIEKLENKLKASRQKWRVMKGTASGVVAGSGVDWARDRLLRDIVLDPE